MRKFVYGAILIPLLVFTSCKSKQQATPFPPANILLITIDTIRPDHLSAYGSSNSTPNLDRLAKKGIVFENAFTHVPLTFPSHTSILSGLFPIHTGVHQNGREIFGKPELLISAVLRKNGYKTGAAVSSFVLDRKFGLSPDFNVYNDNMERAPGISNNFEVERPANKTVGAAINILNQFRSGKWFLWIHFYDPHTPYAPPPPFEGYDGEIQFVDQQIGVLEGWLNTNHMDTNLVQIICGDHGESLGEHGEPTHGFFTYNSTLHVPLLLAYPNAAVRRIKTPAATADIVPTILEMAHVQDSIKRDGESLMDFLENGNRKNDIYFESRYPELMGWNGLRGVFQDNWKLISTTRSELYDWEKDPGENENVFSQKEDVSSRLKKRIADFGNVESASSSQPDSETLEKLKSLGYVSSTSVAKQKGTADPKDKIEVWSEYETSLQLKAAGKNDESLQTLKSLAAQEPTNNFFRVSLASAYRENKQPQSAIPELKTAIQNDPSDDSAYHELALAYKDQRIYPEALKAEQAALALEPQRSEYHNVLGLLYVETGKFQEAKSEFDVVLKIDPNNAVAWNNLGNALREIGSTQQAIDAYQKSIQLSPHYAYPLNGLATIYIRQDRTKDAIPLLQKALDLDPKFVEVYLNLGIAYHSLGDTAKAKTLYLAFLKIAPDWMSQERNNAKTLLSEIH